MKQQPQKKGTPPVEQNSRSAEEEPSAVSEVEAALPVCVPDAPAVASTTEKSNREHP